MVSKVKEMEKTLPLTSPVQTLQNHFQLVICAPPLSVMLFLIFSVNWVTTPLKSIT